MADGLDLKGQRTLIKLEFCMNNIELLCRSGLKIGSGEFAADMKVNLINDGPVTFLLES